MLSAQIINQTFNFRRENHGQLKDASVWPTSALIFLSITFNLTTRGAKPARKDGTDEGWYQQDWCQRRLGREEISAALDSMATLHAAGLAYRMSTKQNFEKEYPALSRDLFTSHVSKELIAKHIDSYLHSLSSILGADKVLTQLRKIQPNVFQHLVALRRPNDELGAR